MPDSLEALPFVHPIKVPGEIVKPEELHLIDAPVAPEEEAAFEKAMEEIREAERIDPIDLMRRIGETAV